MRALVLLLLFAAAAAFAREPVAPLLPLPPDLGPVVDVDAGTVRIAAAGDISENELSHQRDTANLVEAGNYDAVLLLGDDQYPSGALADYQKYFDPTWGRFGKKLKPAPGNHEYRTPAGAGYYDYFGARAGTRGEGWYSFDLGAWHFIALNTNDKCKTVPCGPDSLQLKWLREDLIAHRNRCTIAWWHHPRFSSGMAHGNFDGAQAIWQTLQQFGADVVLNGHEHLYERFMPIGGVREFIVGTGGAESYPFRQIAAPFSELRKTGAFGVLELTLRPGGYDWKFRSVPGNDFTDEGSDTCQ